MIRQEANYHAFAACSATVIAFIGALHEVAGGLLFTWAPAFFGTILWHVVGISVIAIGVLLLCGVLQFIRFPVIPVALMTTAGCLLTVVFIAVVHQQFHFFALCAAIAGIVITIFYHKAGELRLAITEQR